MPEWKHRIWREVFDMWEAQMITLKEAEMLWAMLDKVAEEDFIVRLLKREQALQKAA